MKIFVLIAIIFYGDGLTVIQEFSSQISCEQAGKQIQVKFASVLNPAPRYICVEK